MYLLFFVRVGIIVMLLVLLRVNVLFGVVLLDKVSWLVMVMFVMFWLLRVVNSFGLVIWMIGWVFSDELMCFLWCLIFNVLVIMW